MGEWEDIRIIRHDKTRSESPSWEDIELSRQMLVLSKAPPKRWAEICSAAIVASPGRLGRMGDVNGDSLVIWGGPIVFDERDAEHLKKLVAYANDKYREMTQRHQRQKEAQDRRGNLSARLLLVEPELRRRADNTHDDRAANL